MSKPTWPTIMDDAKTMSRLDFIAKFVAFNTRTKAQRALVEEMYVRASGGGWSYGFTGLPPLMKAANASRLYDAIRRTPLNFYVQAAEDTRVYAHT